MYRAVATSLRRRLRAIRNEYNKIPEGVILLLLGLAALALRLYRLGQVPAGVGGDELFNVIDALRIGPGNWPVYLPGNNGREALYFYLLAGSLRLLGTTILGLRLPSVLLGTGTVLLTYLLGRTLFGRAVAFVASALLAFSLWPVLQSRLALRAITLTFATALTIYLIQRALDSGGRRWWIAAGLALGLTMYTYLPSRGFPAVILAWFVWIWWWRRAQLRRNARLILLAVFLALIVFAPYGAYMLRHPDLVNARIASMENAWDLARAGQPDALLAAILGTARMFTFAGDVEWRYHLSGQPLFDPITGLFFYLGVGVALWRSFRRTTANGQQPAYALLWLWAGAMVAPNALLNENPSALRAMGAMVPLYMLVGVGAVAAYRWLQPRWTPLRKVAPVLLAAGLLLTLLGTWRDYFGTWAHNGQVRRVYNATTALMARTLEDEPPPAGTRVFVAADYVLGRETPLGFSFYSDEPVTWFSQEGTFVWPDATASQGSWYLIPPDHELPPRALADLQAATTVEAFYYDDGTLAFTRYQVAPGAVGWQPAYARDLTFVDGPRLVGYDLPEQVTQGETVTATWHWQIPAGHTGLPNNFAYEQLQLQSEQGGAPVQAEALLGYPQAGWQVGDRFVQQVEMTIPAGMVPGPARVEIGLHDDKGRQYEIVASPVPANAPIVVRSKPLSDFRPPATAIIFGDTVALTEATLSTILAPGTPINVALNWVALQVPPVDYQVELSLYAPGAETPFGVQRDDLWPGIHPSSSWQQFEQVTTFHRLEVPLQLPFAADTTALATLRVRLLDPDGKPLPLTQGSATVAALTVQTRDYRFEAPALAHEVDAQFGKNIRLLGYDLDTSSAHASGELRLTLVWQALAQPAANYIVFNHFVGSDGQLWGQLDQAPAGDAWLTSTWLPGEVVVEERVIPIRANAPPGTYQLLVGLYTPDDIVRLPVTSNGASQPNDQFVLTNVTLR